MVAEIKARGAAPAVHAPSTGAAEEVV
jgi:hypothetical protein